MISLFFRNLFFTILQPGIVAGLVPFWILGGKAARQAGSVWHAYQYLGLFVFTTGFVVMIACIIGFAVHGRGTLSPADPTRSLVSVGLYKFSRNPMYIGVLLILAGESIFFESSALWIYSSVIFVAFHLFIVLVEEPRLRRDFEEEYNAYANRVRRWI